ncbi:Serine/threonine-protein kinase nak1 [Fusarium oxysporum f. sp. rapae]|uniref:non-specific serine/threonine protein kinase n=1 Tax=Fusarium oxysporum f. sp. rapae TaxID=485398 RepID=A0A8J5NH59_FUSOX|nr:Serine/threonine-protein kinase nak1 [Fusarium oxysporum f. sp. rapae]KAG7402703.1 Serine/threonine-protein kinase nak1 [Fusarium oxysporum f. sp. rapae]
MTSLLVSNPHLSAIRQNAFNDAREMQNSVVQDCAATGKEPPSYSLLELIGKGSFGRVYKARSTKSDQLVAVKIINIDNGDALDPSADTFGDILKEVETLKLLGSSGAKNINTVVDVLLVRHTIWMVTEYCAGGSVSTLMKPRGYLPEQWIIPILREVAEAIHWVHGQGIIHRDIKCANVLITEAGGVQLCDFGVAGIVETKFDKRSTVTGSLHWMAPELFNSSVRYGSEVDIWAFGSMAYEVASGLPPNANFRDISRFGTYLKQHCPRLEGNQYSQGLKNLIAYCLVEDIAQRPSIEEIQRHPYIFNTDVDYPTVSLARLVYAYKIWEAKGGSRTSLFSPGGAQRESSPPSSLASHDEWIFSTMDDLNQLMVPDSSQPILELYNTTVDTQSQVSRSQPRRRRQPPTNMNMPVVPLEKAFDPNTISNYQDNIRYFYSSQRLPLTSDLPLRDHSESLNVRESLIDLDAALGDRLSLSPELSTIKPRTRSASNDPTDSDRRRTLDWTFPAEVPTSTSPLDRVEPVNSDVELTLVQAQRDLAVETSMQPTASVKRASTLSLIDLDASMPDDSGETTRPSTAISDAPSSTSEMWHTPFELEGHTFESMPLLSTSREPSIYVDGGDFSTALHVAGDPNQTIRHSTGPTNQQSLSTAHSEDGEIYHPLGHDFNNGTNGNPMISLPPLPKPPATEVMQGISSVEDVKDELLRLVSSFKSHLDLGNQMLETLPARQRHVVPRESSP